MSTEARCRECGKLLGSTNDSASLEVRPIACHAGPGELIFTVKCPRCAKFNFIKMRPND